MRLWGERNYERTILRTALMVLPMALASAGTSVLERRNDVYAALLLRQAEYEETGRATFLMTDAGNPCDPFISENDKGGNDDFLVSVFLLPGVAEEVCRLRIFHDDPAGREGMLEEVFLVRDKSPTCQAAASILDRERLLPGNDLDAFLAEKPDERGMIDDYGKEASE